MWTGTARCLTRGGVVLLLLLTGCSPHAAVPAALDAASDTLAPGIIHRAIPTDHGEGIDLIDVDLARAPMRLAVATEGIKRVDGLVTGRAYTPHEWLDRKRALAAANGGYFGLEVGADRKEILGLLVQHGKVRRAARYVRSAFGLLPQGQPDIEWAATEAGSAQAVRCYASPRGALRPKSIWTAQAAVGCGPTLLHNGKIQVTDRQERLVSPGREARTFVAYDDGPAGTPRHFVLGMASGMTYQDLATFLVAYFPRYDRTQATNAMCLDGGASTQLSYRLPDGTVQSPRETGVTVPDAVLILPR